MKSYVLQLITTLLRVWFSLGIDDIFMERMSGAMTNSVYSVNVEYTSLPKLGPSEPSKLLLRIYGQGLDGMISRRREFECTQRLAESGIAPKWLGIFGNGRFEEFVRNIPVTSEMIREPEFASQIARKVFHLHCKADSSYEESTDQKQKSVLWKRLAAWRTKALEALQFMQNPDHRLSQSESLKDLLILGITDQSFDNQISERKIKCKEKSSPIVLCHNDLHQGNLMIRKEDHSIILIDFEYASMAPRGFDIANHFCEWAADYAGDHPESLDYVNRFPNYDQQMVFITAYCEEATLNGQVVDPIKLYDEVQVFIPISHLLWGHWGIIQASKSYIDFDYLRYSVERLEQYEIINNF